LVREKENFSSFDLCFQFRIIPSAGIRWWTSERRFQSRLSTKFSWNLRPRSFPSSDTSLYNVWQSSTCFLYFSRFDFVFRRRGDGVHYQVNSALLGSVPNST